MKRGKKIKTIKAFCKRLNDNLPFCYFKGMTGFDNEMFQTAEAVDMTYSFSELIRGIKYGYWYEAEK